MFDAPPPESRAPAATRDELRRADEAAVRRHLLAGWLDRLCRSISGIDHAVVAVGDAPDTLIDAAWPARAEARLVAELRALATAAAVNPDAVCGPGPRMGIKLEIAAAAHAAVAVVLKADAPPGPVRELVAWSANWLEAVLDPPVASGSRAAAGGADVGAVLDACRARVEVSDQALAAATAIANRYGLDEVAIGIVDTGRVRLLGISHAAGIDRRQHAVAVSEAALAGAVERGTGFRMPADDALVGEYVAAGLPGRLRSVVIRFRAPSPFDEERTAALGTACRLAADLIALNDAAAGNGRGGRVGRGLSALRSSLGGLGRLPAAGLAALAALVVLWALAYPATLSIGAPAALEGSRQRAVVAPFEGFIAASHARPGETVAAGQVLVEMERSTLELERNKLAAERGSLAKQYNGALAVRDQAEARILGARLERIDAELALLDARLDKTRLLAPFDGVVIKGDLSRSLGAPVARGDTLLELAPLEDYRVVLTVDEADVHLIEPGQTGRLTLTAWPGERHGITVDKVAAVAPSEDGVNRFRVEASIDTPLSALRPGMQGVAKVDAGRAPPIWRATRRTVGWLRLNAWARLP